MNEELREQLSRNIGRACYVLESCRDWYSFGRNNDRNTTILRVEMYENYPAYQVKNGDSPWWVNIEHISFPQDLVPPKPFYTSTCSICHKPSRKLKSSVACSNVKCKSWKLLKKALNLNTNKIIAGTYENPIVVLCPVCNKLATSMATNEMNSSGYYGHSSYCSGGCMWQPYSFVSDNWYEYVGGKVKAVSFVSSGRTKWKWSTDNG